MTLSIWRYSHLALAVFSFIFLLIAALTGIILSFEPLSQRVQAKTSNQFLSYSLAETLPALREKYPDIAELSVGKDKSVLVKGTDENGAKLEAYVNPTNGTIIGEPVKQSPFFQWVTSLHRSLFLHETGRAVVGITAFILSLITASGIALIIKRQLGIRNFFARITRDSFVQYYHVFLGRLSLIPILMIATTGAYLAIVRFEFIKKEKQELKVDFDTIKDGPQIAAKDFEFFRKTKLGEIVSVEFPFSTDYEDYYIIHTENGDVALNQVTGTILAETKISKAAAWENLSLSLHTGRDSLVWALVLTLASANILFFIYSGFAITLKRIGGKTKNKFKAKDADIVILVGSEGGSTFRYAHAIYKQLLTQNRKPYVSQLNDYQNYPNAKQLIFFTATYGLGEAPSNAKKFESLVAKCQQKDVSYSVLGFGSYAYAEFCKFAYDLEHLLTAQTWAKPLIALHTVADQSLDDFNVWLHQWSQYAAIPLTALGSDFLKKKEKQADFKVIDVSPTIDETFTVRLKSKRNLSDQSGDLLAIYPAGDHRERLYSIGKFGKEIQLCVKLHEHGLGSSFLHHLKAGNHLKAKIVRNKHFHFPMNTKRVVMIANGTGIAPFLGMIHSNNPTVETHLYCGFRYRSTYQQYDPSINASLQVGRLKNLHLALSREETKQYVYDLVERDALFFASTLADGGTVMLCGSLLMQKDVLEVLDKTCQDYNGRELSYYQAKQQILVDCY